MTAPVMDFEVVFAHARHLGDLGATCLERSRSPNDDIADLPLQRLSDAEVQHQPDAQFA